MLSSEAYGIVVDKTDSYQAVRVLNSSISVTCITCSCITLRNLLYFSRSQFPNLYVSIMLMPVESYCI